MTVEALREVRLYGALGRQFGRVHRLAVLTPAEAVQALCAVLPGFERAFVGQVGKPRARYHLFVGRGAQRQTIATEEVHDPVGVSEPIRIVPVIEGAKRGGVLQIIVGVVILVAAAYGYGNEDTVRIGWQLVVSGLVQAITPVRRYEQKQTADNLPSYGFDGGAVNASQQGLPVPLAFGRMIVGATTISGGLSTDEIVLPAPAAIPDATLPSYMNADALFWSPA